MIRPEAQRAGLEVTKGGALLEAGSIGEIANHAGRNVNEQSLEMPSWMLTRDNEEVHMQNLDPGFS